MSALDISVSRAPKTLTYQLHVSIIQTSKVKFKHQKETVLESEIFGGTYLPII